jgi:hypothetical protein
MSWQNEMTTMVRILVNDSVAPYQFSDERIEQTILVAGKYVQFDVVLDHPYTIDVSNNALSPDPTVDNDEIFIILTTLKAACLIDQGSLRTKAAMEGVRAALGPASLSVSGAASGWEMILKHGPCKLYDDLVEHWDVANASAIAAVLGPFSGNKFDPTMQRSSTRFDPYRTGFYS